MDAWLTRAYSRLGSHYVIWTYALLGVVTVALAAVPFAVAAHYMRLSVDEFALSFAIAGGAVAATLAIALAAIWKEIEALKGWEASLAGHESTRAAAEAAFELPRRWLLFACAGIPLLMAPASCLGIAVAAGQLNTTHAVEIAIGALFAGFAALLFFYSSLELAMRPVRRKIGLTSLPHHGHVGLATRLGLLLICVPGLIAIGVGGLQNQSGTGSLFVVYAASLAGVVLATLAMAPLLTGTVLSPIQDLIRGTRSVARGDLESEVVLTTSDEIGELAESFNEMIAEIRGKSEALEASRGRIVAASDEARRQVERDLHDGAQQSLVLLNLKLGLADRKLQDDAETAGDILAEARADLDRALAQLRDLAHGIYPAALTNGGLRAALAEVSQQASIETVISSNGVERYAPEVEAAVYFCCLEALQNAAKHAGAGAKATIELSVVQGRLRFEVRDDGPGFDLNRLKGGAGLDNMADRIGALGGEFEIVAEPGQGTRVSGVVSVRPTGS